MGSVFETKAEIPEKVNLEVPRPNQGPKEKSVKKKTISSFAMLALLLALSSPSPAAGKHPQIEDAMHALHSAKDHILAVQHDFGGHRTEAIRAIDEAYHQLEICLQF
jgi:hypothetical protein